ncbi:hypothetical protein [Rhizobium terrae]|uniref:hypothetical protein n=1 Tax=Rhizobium terrae TaxID=2171756 RepID=UPI0013C2EC2E|nr:hypothetical protein [Rhizobium terrae]
MPHPVDRVRGHVYPRSRALSERDSLHASNIILGMLGVMLVVFGVAYAITLAAV